MLRAPLLLATIALLLGGVTTAANTPDDLPLPAHEVMLLQENPGASIGLPLGATKSYAVGRSLQQMGESEAALVYLDRAYRLAPDSPRIASAYARSLVETGYVGDAARVFGRLVSLDPDDLAQRQQYAQLLAQSGRTVLALEQVRELRRRGQDDPGIIKFEADLLGQLGRIDEAVSVYREAARRDPDRTEDYVLAAGLLMQKHERLEDMADLLEDGLDADPLSMPMRVALIRYLAHGGRVEEARDQARKGDDARRRAGLSERPEISLELAEVLARWGDYETAVSVLRDARDRGFRDRETEAQMSRYLLTLGDHIAAREVLQPASRQWSDDAELRFLLGRALEMDDDIAGALASLEAAVDRAPEVPLYRISLLRLLVIHRFEALGVPDPDDQTLALQTAAREHARVAAGSVHPQDAAGHMILGTTFRALTDYDRAIRHFALAADIKENRVPAMLELGYSQQQAGKLDEARQTLATVYAEYPDDPEVLNSYGYFLAEMNSDLEQAETMITRALQADPENGAYLDSMGWVLYQQQRYAEAFDFLIRATNERGEDAVILEHLGRTLAQLGRGPEAVDILQRALAVGGDPEVLQPIIDELRTDG